jgi:hypothetical protein
MTDWLQIRNVKEISIGGDFMSDGRHQRIILISTEEDKKVGELPTTVEVHFQITVTGKEKIKVDVDR